MILLIDSGSTHGFIDSNLAQKLNLPKHQTKTYEVQVANGQKLQGSEMCSQILLTCQGCKMPIDLLLLPMKGCDVVLGIQWMREFNEIYFDFRKLRVRFKNNAREFMWQGLTNSQIQHLNDKNISKELNSSSLKFMLLSTTTVQNIHPDIVHILTDFHSVTSPQNSLPPKRECDHKILLLHGSKPVCLKPYRHSYHIKTELEKLIKEMLDMGIIRNSTSAFSAPVVIVKKRMVHGDYVLIIGY